MSDSNPTVERLEDQITWYDHKSTVHQRWYKTLKFIEIVSAALIPLSAGFGWSAYVTGVLGVLVVILVSVQSLNQLHHNWITYRSTCEELKHEKYLWLAKAGDYSKTEHPDKLLAERVESLVSREHTKWVTGRKHTEHEKK